MNDNGYQDYINQKKLNNAKRLKLFVTILSIISIIGLFVFFFGYDAPLFDHKKLIEFGGGFISLLILDLLIVFIKYRNPKFIPKCNKCEHKIKDINKDCIMGNIKNLGTVDRTTYENITSTIKGTTTYPRGGYSMRNSAYEKTSETNFEVKSKIPVVKKFYIYELEYLCKNCHKLFCTKKIESLEPIERNI